MPLPSVDIQRNLLHTRQIVLRGWKRDDGYWDIEARLTDIKDHDYPLASGLRRQGEPIHDIWVRATIDRQFNILDAAASLEATPYPDGCGSIAPDYRQIAGLNLLRGFRRALAERFDSTRGCSHTTELFSLLPTAAIQTLASEVTDTEGRYSEQQPYQLDRCHALETSSETVRRYYPRWYCERQVPSSNQLLDIQQQGKTP